MRLLALAGGAEDLELLLLLARTPHEVSLIGWHGHAGAVEPLLGVLQERASSLLLGGALGESRPQAAARALQRITGAIESDDEPPPEASQFARSDAVTTHVGRWREWYEAHRDELSHRTKYRFGKPYRPAASLDELVRPSVAFDVRSLVELEVALVAGAGATSTLRDLEDWVACQRDGVALTRHHFEKYEQAPTTALHVEGEWPAQRLGKRHDPVDPSAAAAPSGTHRGR